MDCREFRNKHSAFVDERCSDAEENAMRGHLASCASCSRHDTLIRRGQLLVRNLPRIEPSPDFQARLEARLRAIPHERFDAAWMPRLAFARFAVAAALLALATFVSFTTLRHRPARALRLDPVVAMLPEVEAAPSPVATPALVATVPTGMPVWPGIIVATQAPLHFVAAELESER